MCPEISKLVFDQFSISISQSYTMANILSSYKGVLMYYLQLFCGVLK